MAGYVRFATETGVAVCFRNPRNRGRAGSENTNGILH